MSEELEKLLLELYTPAEAFEWLFTPHPLFEGKSAINMIFVGAADRVLNALRQVSDGTYT